MLHVCKVREKGDSPGDKARRAAYVIVHTYTTCIQISVSYCTGAPLIIHPGRDQQSPSHILDVLEAAGADLSRTVMSHIDRTMFSDDALLQLAKRGCYLEYDLFGIECSHYQVRYLLHCIYLYMLKL